MKTVVAKTRRRASPESMTLEDAYLALASRLERRAVKARERGEHEVADRLQARRFHVCRLLIALCRPSVEESQRRRHEADFGRVILDVY